MIKHSKKIKKNKKSRGKKTLKGGEIATATLAAIGLSGTAATAAAAGAIVRYKGMKKKIDKFWIEDDGEVKQLEKDLQGIKKDYESDSHPDPLHQITLLDDLWKNSYDIIAYFENIKGVRGQKLDRKKHHYTLYNIWDRYLSIEKLLDTSAYKDQLDNLKIHKYLILKEIIDSIMTKKKVIIGSTKKGARCYRRMYFTPCTYKLPKLSRFLYGLTLKYGKKNIQFNLDKLDSKTVNAYDTEYKDVDEDAIKKSLDKFKDSKFVYTIKASKETLGRFTIYYLSKTGNMEIKFNKWPPLYRDIKSTKVPEKLDFDIEYDIRKFKEELEKQLDVKFTKSGDIYYIGTQTISTSKPSSSGSSSNNGDAKLIAEAKNKFSAAVNSVYKNECKYSSPGSSSNKGDAKLIAEAKNKFSAAVNSVYQNACSR